MEERQITLNERPGCLGGLARLAILGWIFDWLQDNVGFGRGGILGYGCGCLLLVVGLIFACSILFGTNWFEFGF
jgi:hypothetical protein